MYRSFYGLRVHPFTNTPDPRFLYLSRQAHDAFANLFYSLSRRHGFVVLTGEVGTGKTTLLTSLVQELRKRRISCAQIVNPNLEPVQFLELVTTELGVPCASREKGALLQGLQRWLQRRNEAGGSATLIVDEAHMMPLETMEELRLLTNFETPTGKLLQAVLAGQPELEHKLNLPQMRQLKQRIVSRCRLLPLSLEETQGYIQSRLTRAGAQQNGIFPPDTVQAIRTYSRGIPRLINLVCENSLIAGYAAQMRRIPVKVVEEVAREILAEEESPVNGATTLPPGHDPVAVPAGAEANPEMWAAFCEFMKVFNRRQGSGE